ncbi:hypothetical protein PPS11_29511 [Pseudomonas putida S11]|nr:hypothetical protein PPS11_29511 [Pseudomonas putida S11]
MATTSAPTATGTVVDHERVAGGFQYVAHHRVGPVARERLGAGDLVGELRGEVTERLQAVGQRRVALAQAFQRVGGFGEAAIGVGAHDDGIGFAVDDFVAVDHGNDRFAGLALGDPGLHLRVAGFVIDHRLAGGGAAGGGQAHFFFGEGIAVGAAELGHYHYLAEQAVGNVARSALAAEGGGFARGGKSAFAFGVQGIAAGAAGADEEVAITPGVGRNVGDAVDRLHAVDLEADHALGHLLVGDEAFGGFVFELRPLLFALRLFGLDAVLVGVGLVVEQVGQVDGKAFTGGHPQHDGPRALVRAQGDLARYRRPAAAEGDPSCRPPHLRAGRTSCRWRFVAPRRLNISGWSSATTLATRVRWHCTAASLVDSQPSKARTSDDRMGPLSGMDMLHLRDTGSLRGAGARCMPGADCFNFQ